LRHVYFDLDGTLTDPAPGIVACIEYALHELGARASGDLRRFIGPSLRESFAELLETQERERIEEAMRLYRERFSTTGLYENAVYDGVETVLGELCDRGFALRVVTSKPKVYADRIVDHFELRRFFPTVYGPELSGELSDKAELLAHVLTAEAAAPGQVCMIGDRRHDVLGAKANELRAIGVLWGYGDELELQTAGADRIVARVVDLPTAIGELT